MDKIFKSNTIMGIVAIATLVLVGIMFWRVQKANTKYCDNAIAGGADVNPKNA